jgi:urea transporter
VDTAFSILEEHAKTVRLQTQPFVAGKLHSVRTDPVFQQYVYPFLAQGRPGIKAAATNQMAFVASLAQGFAQVFIHQNIISSIITLALDFWINLIIFIVCSSLARKRSEIHKYCYVRLDRFSSCPFR